MSKLEVYFQDNDASVNREKSPSFDQDVDPIWYKQRYPDVDAASAEPVEHYRCYGRFEGRFPNAKSELMALGEVVDENWYRARYPDIADTNVDPTTHYLSFGRAEGRYPNADREPREIWRTRFDPTWYRARNPDLGCYRDDPLEHYRRIGLLEGRAANALEENRATWQGIFDAGWYLTRNPDVALRGVDPLEHFITEGLIDRRRPNADTILEAESVISARILRLKGQSFANEVALFVTHTSDGVIKPHVEHHVNCLQQCGIEVVLIVVCDDLDAIVTGAAYDLADHVFRRANAGFDFAAWAHVLRLYPVLFGAKILYLVNDSVFGPTRLEALEQVIDRIRMSPADLVGLTDNADRGWHIQSYFLAFKSRFLVSETARAFFDTVVAYIHKNDVVNEYETQLARYAIARGFCTEVLFPTPDWLDATLHNWRKLLRAGFPYLKVGTVRGLVRDIETADWRTEMVTRGYDTSPADRTLARLAREECSYSSTLGGTESDNERQAQAAMHHFLADGGVLALPTNAAPRVSFITVLDGRPALALRLLCPLIQGGQSQIDIVVVDNATIDDTHHVLGRLIGVTIITNVAPLPPLRAARRAAALARTEIVVLLRPERDPIADSKAFGTSLCAQEHVFMEMLESIFADSSKITFEPGAAPADAPWCSFSLIFSGEHLGTAHAMLRRDAPQALKQLFGFLQLPSAGEAPDVL